MNFHKLSRYWNRLAYLVINIGQKMIWDYTGKNKDILGEYTCSDMTRELMTGKQ